MVVGEGARVMVVGERVRAKEQEISQHTQRDCPVQKNEAISAPQQHRRERGVNKIMKDKTIVAVTAIAAITAIEMVALSMGINGTILALSLAAVAGVGGYKLKTVIGEKK